MSAVALMSAVASYQLPETLGVTLPSSCAELLRQESVSRTRNASEDRQPLLAEDA